MTQIPSDLPASAAQAGIQAGEVAKDRDARRSGNADAARRQLKAVDEAGATVDTDDADVAIFADAEGTGSEGRENLEPEETPEEETQDDGDGIRRDDDGQLHVDLEA